ncbi:MAG: hypothetical protein J6X18_00650 [Bacteroidales bacterium]|nr:hypothetical protein [Bacteroidales bacterium]
MKYYNTQELIETLTGKNASFIQKEAKIQEERYGNVDVWEAWVDEDEIVIDFGENDCHFMFNENGEIYDTYGHGCGLKNFKQIESCAKELHSKC